MTINCKQCGSSRIFRSRFRAGERSPSNLLLAPYRCRDCKTRFWAKNNDAYLIVTAGAGSIFLFTTLIWIGFSSDTFLKSNYASQLNSTKSPPSQNSTELQPGITSTEQIRSEAIARRDEINLQSIIEEEAARSKLDANDSRFYTVSLFLEKAKQGNADAQYQLGLLYLMGKGTLQDFSEASEWLILAAEQNHPLAQYELGLLYQIGQGVEMDNEKSYVWFNLAAAAGVEQAALARDKAMRALNREQLASAQKIAREWLNSRDKDGKQLSGLIRTK